MLNGPLVMYTDGGFVWKRDVGWLRHNGLGRGVKALDLICKGDTHLL